MLYECRCRFCGLQNHQNGCIRLLNNTTKSCCYDCEIRLQGQVRDYYGAIKYVYQLISIVNIDVARLVVQLRLKI